MRADEVRRPQVAAAEMPADEREAGTGRRLHRGQRDGCAHTQQERHHQAQHDSVAPDGRDLRARMAGDLAGQHQLRRHHGQRPGTHHLVGHGVQQVRTAVVRGLAQRGLQRDVSHLGGPAAHDDPDHRAHRAAAAPGFGQQAHEPGSAEGEQAHRRHELQRLDPDVDAAQHAVVHTQGPQRRQHRQQQAGGEEGQRALPVQRLGPAAPKEGAGHPGRRLEEGAGTHAATPPRVDDQRARKRPKANRPAGPKRKVSSSTGTSSACGQPCWLARWAIQLPTKRSKAR